MKILVINCGSSSLKYQLIDMDGEKVLCKGLCDRIGIAGSSIEHKVEENSWKREVTLPNHSAAFNEMIAVMTEGDGAVLKDKSDIGGIGHRVVQGGQKFTQSVLVNNEVINTVEELAPLAPMHNPACALGLRSARQVFGQDMPQVAVFDTTFHTTMPAKAFMYAIPYEYYENYDIRRYGFHGTSHRYVSLAAARFLGKDPADLKLITCHLGNGSSLAAVDGGKCVDTSMGLTPVAGLIMGTRCGDLDPGVVCYMNELTGASGNKMSDILNKKSGFLGVSGVSSDNRDIEAAAEEGNKRAQLVQQMLAYQLQKYIGSYVAAMNGLDALIFTGGIGENSAGVRANTCNGLSFFGIGVDPEKNKVRGQTADISSADATVRTLIIPTNEELMIARDTLEIIGSKTV